MTLNTCPIKDIKNGYLVGKFVFTYLEQLYLKADAKLCVITISSDIEF